MDLVGNDVDTLHEEIEYLMGHLMGNDVNTLHEERIYLVEFSLIRVTVLMGKSFISSKQSSNNDTLALIEYDN
jgi:hypothetical protein